MPKTAALFTLGCKLNQYETFYIKERLTECGFAIVSSHEVADLYVVNSCTVTKKSDYHSRQAVRKFVRRNPAACVIVTGCSAQIDPESFRKIEGVDCILGNSQKQHLTDFLKELTKDSSKRKEPFVCVRPDPTDQISMFINNFQEYTRAFIKVQQGCNAECSYCIVPQARGRCRSISEDKVIAQAAKLIAQGYKEIVLTGTHLGQYGQDFSHNVTLSDLIAQIIELPGFGRLRLSSIEPREFTPPLLKLIAQSAQICAHVHIPLQSGDDSILKRMARDYTTHYYEDLVTQLMSRNSLAIGADVIVGFPGESDESFMRTYDFIEDLPLAYLHVFSYSPRPHTKAFTMKDHISGEVKRQRSKILRALSTKKKIEFRSRFITKEMIALILNQDGHDSESKVGLTENYIPVSIKHKRIRELVNHFVLIRLTSLDGSDVKGTVVDVID